MPLPVKLNDVIDEMEIQSDAHSCYLNKKTGDIAGSDQTNKLIIHGKALRGKP